MDKVKERLSKTYTTVKEKWTSIAGRTRVVILAVAGVIIASAIILTAILNTTTYVTLCKASGEHEVVDIQAALAGVGIIDVQVTSDNKVLVKENVEMIARVAISERGLPSPGSGFNNDIWDTGVGMFSTDTQMKEKQKQQLQAWIMSHLSVIPEVDRAMVTLHIPETSNYVMVENRQEARASVTLVLKTGQTLSNDQIKGIHKIILNAVPDLEDFNITVNDGNGIQLIPDDIGISAGEDLALRQQRLSMEADFKKLMSRSAADELGPLLDAAFGVGRHATSVNVELDNSDNKEVYDEVFTPSEGLDGGIVKEIIRNAAAGGVALEGGAIGQVVDGDLSPGYPTIPDIEAGADFYVEWGENIKYEINKRIESYSDTGLRLVKTTASVVVDSGPMTPAEIETWEGLVRNATGASEVSFIPMAFPLQPTPGIQGEGSGFNVTKNVLIYIIIALGVLLIILFVLALTTSGSKKKRLIRNRGVAVVADASGGYIKDDSFQPSIEQEGFDLPSLLEENDTKDVVLKREIKEFSKSNPDIIAQLIRTWLREED